MLKKKEEDKASYKFKQHKIRDNQYCRISEHKI